MQAKTRVLSVLLVLFLVVSVFGELFSVVPRVWAFSAETRYFTSTSVSTNHYNLSNANTASASYYTMSGTPLLGGDKIYFGVRVEYCFINGTNVTMSGSSTVGIATFTMPNPGNGSFNPQSNGTYTITNTTTYSGLNAVQLQFYYGYASTATTASGRYWVTENTTSWNRLKANAWTIAYWAYCHWDAAEEWYDYVRFEFGSSGYNSRIANFEFENFVAGGITYSNFASNATQTMAFASEHLNVSCTFTATGGTNLSSYSFGTNNTGAAFTYDNTTFSVGLTTASVYEVFLLNSTGEKNVGFTVSANNTDNAWNTTSVLLVYVWKSIPDVSDHNLGNTVGLTRNGQYFNGTATGGKDCIYVAYQDSTDNWYIKGKAYDMTASSWSAAYNILTSGVGVTSHDTHWAPAITVLPDGRLMVLYGYYEISMYYKVSTYSAKTESNTSKLLTEWGSERKIDSIGQSVGKGVAYPTTLRWDDRMVLFFRDYSLATYANWTQVFYEEAANKTIYPDAWDGTWDDWARTGTSPYLTAGDANYISVSGVTANQSSGWFTFGNMKGDQIVNDTITSAKLRIKATVEASKVKVMLNNGTATYDLGYLSAGTGAWTAIDVSAYVKTSTVFNATKIYLNHTATSGTTTVYDAQLEAIYTGFEDPVDWLDPPYYTGAPIQLLYCAHQAYGDNILAGWYYGNGTDMDVGVYFAYSDNKGDTWKCVNGTAVTLPMKSESMKVATSTGRSTDCVPTLDENGKPSIFVVYESNDWVIRNITGSQIKLCYYNNTLGNSGSWTLGDITDENGTAVSNLIWYPNWYFLDPYYNRPSFWATSSSNGFIGKYTRQYANTTYFKQVWNSGSVFPNYKYQLFTMPIRNCVSAYEVIMAENRISDIGNYTNGANLWNVNTTDLIACKYVAPYTTTLISGEFRGKTSIGAQEAYQFYIFDAAFNVIYQSASANYLTGTSGDGWLLYSSFTSSPTLYVGTTYWIGLELFGAPADMQLYYHTDTGSIINNTVWMNGSTWTEGFSDKTFYNRTMNYVCFSSSLSLRGLGVDDYVTRFTNIGTNASDIQSTTQIAVFYTWATDANEFSYINFTYNATGSYVTTFQAASTGAAVWLNITKTMPVNAGVWAWQIGVNDTIGNWAYTGIQYVTINLNVSFSFAALLQQFASFSFSKMLSFANIGLLTIYASSSFGKAIGFIGDGIVNLFSSLTANWHKLFLGSSILNMFGSNGLSKLMSFEQSSLLNVYGSSVFGKAMFFGQAGMINIVGSNAFSLSLQCLTAALLTIFSSVAYVTELMVNVLSVTRFDLINSFGSVEFGKSLFFGQSSLVNIIASPTSSWSLYCFVSALSTVFGSVSYAVSKVLTTLSTVTFGLGLEFGKSLYFGQVGLVSFVSNLQGIWSLNFIANTLTAVYGSIAFATEFLVNILTTTKFDSLFGYGAVQFAKSIYFGQTGLISFISNLQGSWGLSYLAGALLTIYSSVAYAVSLAVNTLSTIRFDQFGFYGSVWFAKSVVFQQSSWLALFSSVSSAFALIWINVVSIASGLVVPSGVAWLVVPAEVTRFWFAVAAFFIGATTLGGALLVLSRKEKSRI